MKSSCIHCGTNVEHTPDDVEMYRTFETDPIAICFACDHKRRLCFRNGRKLYRRDCDFTKAPIVSIYSADKPYKVYKSDVWYGDNWDALEYGRDIDFNRPFFEQLRELQLQVPRLALTNINPTNSDYCNMSEGNKNCYLIFGGDFNEDSMYGTFGMHNKSVVDCDNSNDSERCYWMSDSFNCYGCRFTYDSKNCSDCAFISDCTGCRDCILCTNLVQKQYCIENVQCSKEEYEKRKSTFLDGVHSTQLQNVRRLGDLRAKRIVRPTHILSSENCSGDYIINSKNCHNCYDAWDCEDMRNVILASKAKDCFRSDCVGEKSELCFSLQSTINAYASRCSFSIFDSQSVEYSDFVVGSKNAFGCVGLRKKEHCILNKQYSKEEFDKTRLKLKAHMQRTGEWNAPLPASLSCFHYNESTAHDFFPLTKEQALKEGFTWNELPEETLGAARFIQAAMLPQNIADIPDDILNWAIACEETGKPFRLIKQELDFYRDNAFPVPHLHPDTRHRHRFDMRTPKTLWKRACAHCSKKFETVYSPDRSESVYCEDCYLKEVY